VKFLESHQPSSSHKAVETAPLSQQSNQITPTQSTLNAGMLQLKSVLADPALPLTPSHIIQLQKTIGNRAVAQLMKSRMQAVEPVQKVEIPEEEALQQKPIQKKENKTGMPESLKSGLENLSGMDMSDVRVHYNSDKPAQLQALAYAQGNDIHIGTGQEQHLPHEGWHVVQQRQGRVAQTSQTESGRALNDDASLEQEADQMGLQAQTFAGAEGGSDTAASDAAPSSVIQQRLPEMTNEFIADNTEMAREILLHGLANMSSGERDTFVAAVNVSRVVKIDFEKLREELIIADAGMLKAWSPYIKSQTADSKKFTSTVDSPDSVDPTADELEIIKTNIQTIIDGIGTKHTNEDFIKSIFGPTVNTQAVGDVYDNICFKLFEHQQASTAPVGKSSEKDHDEWTGVGGFAKAGADKVTFSDKEYTALLSGTPESLAILIHEYSHVVDGKIIDHAYSLDDMAKLTTKQRTENAETYAQAYLEMTSATNAKRLYDESKVVQPEAAVIDAPSTHLKRRMKAIKSNLTAMWSITDDAYRAVKKLHTGEYGADIKSGLVDVASFPYVVDVATDHVRLQALLEDRSKRYSEIGKKLVSVLKAEGVTRELLSDPELDDAANIPLFTALSIQKIINLSDSNATQLVNGLVALKS
jgi:hypothetical protein